MACIRSAAIAARAPAATWWWRPRSERIVQVARETGYLDDIQEFRGLDAYQSLPRDRILALCTGSQGEGRAALARIAEAQHPSVTLDRGDRVIFSSRTIPGNEKEVGRVINGLIRQGIEVITDRTHLVHVSGHPRLAEMEEMYGWVRPRIVVPVHGEALHLSEHAAFARRLGVPEVVVSENGDLIRLAPGPASIIDEVPAARLYKDGRLLIEADVRTVPDRRRLSFAGMASIALAVTDKGELAADPEVELIGIPLHTPVATLDDIAYDAVMETFESLPRRAAAIPKCWLKPCVAPCARPSGGTGAAVCHVRLASVVRANSRGK